MFTGSMTALITPFKNGEIDRDAFQSFVKWQVDNGTHGLIPCGTTGESPTLTHEEHQLVVELCVEAAEGRCPVIAGAGSNATHEAITLAKHAQKSGVDGILVVSPYYNKPSQEGIFQHYKMLNDAVDIPIILYNVPSRTGSNIELETVYRLAELPNIAGIKDAVTDLSRPLLMRRALGEDFCLLSGEDGTAVAYLAQGGQGCISVTSNIAPKLCSDMHNAWQTGDLVTVRALNERLILLHDAMFCDTSPAPAKYAASKLGLCQNEIRMPLMVATAESRVIVDEAMKSAGIVLDNVA